MHRAGVPVGGRAADPLLLGVCLDGGEINPIRLGTSTHARLSAEYVDAGAVVVLAVAEVDFPKTVRAGAAGNVEYRGVESGAESGAESGVESEMALKIMALLRASPLSKAECEIRRSISAEQVLQTLDVCAALLRVRSCSGAQ